MQASQRIGDRIANKHPFACRLKLELRESGVDRGIIAVGNPVIAGDFTPIAADTDPGQPRIQRKSVLRRGPPIGADHADASLR